MTKSKLPVTSRFKTIIRYLNTGLTMKAMKELSHTWLTDHTIDFEYKKYTLLAYLQNVKEKFGQHKLYPQLSDLIKHYDNLVQLKNNKEYIFSNFPKTVTGIDIERLRITYKQLIQDDELMKQLSEIIYYAIPQLGDSINHGKDLYQYVEEYLSFDEVGLMPIYQNEGYILITENTERNLAVYRYRLSLISHLEETMAIHTNFVANELKSISNTAHQIKLNLTKNYSDLPNPATFLVTSQRQFPMNETMLPIAKILLMKHLKHA